MDTLGTVLRPLDYTDTVKAKSMSASGPDSRSLERPAREDDKFRISSNTHPADSIRFHRPQNLFVFGL
jgi:hypothetical protein